MVDPRGRHGESCAERAVHVAGNQRVVGRRFALDSADQVNLRDLVALCDNLTVHVRVDVLAGAKSWQAQGTCWFLEVYLRRAFRRTQWESDAAGAVHDGMRRQTHAGGFGQ